MSENSKILFLTYSDNGSNVIKGEGASPKFCSNGAPFFINQRCQVGMYCGVDLVIKDVRQTSQ